jgi:lambda family phage tail tape measure protein
LAPPTKVPGDRAQEPAKELTAQLNAVKSLADGYRRLSESNTSRYQLEVDILGKNKEEVETMRGLSDINKRYGDQRAALEEKLKGAKGATVRLIKTEIANLDVLKTKETAAYLEARKKISANAENIAQTKIILDLMEQQAQAAQEIAGFQSQQGQAKVQAFEQVKAQQDSLDLLGKREELERSIRNMRGSDQDYTRSLFDLENQRKTQLESIQKIQNLPFEGVGGIKQKMEEVNALYDARIAKIQATQAQTKMEQDSFTFGWDNALEKWRNNIKTDAEYAADQMKTFTQGFEDAIVKMVQTGKLSFKDLFNSLIAQAVRVQSTKLLSSLFGMFGFGPVGITGGGGGGAMANGGPVQGNTPYLIGERGPELFVPQSAGKIIPHHSLGGGGQSIVNNNTAVTYSIQAVDASSFRSMLARDPEFIHNVAEQGRRQMPIRSRR